jgi:hypothetical protein
MERSESIKELTAALSKAQIAFLPIKKTEKVDYQTTAGRKKYNYAPLSEVIDATKKGLSDNGLAVMQPTKIVESHLFVETLLCHSSGEWIKSEMFVGDMNQAPQSEGSSLTYKRRYSLSAMLNIASEEDDDAQEAESEQSKKAPATSQNKAQTPEQAHWCAKHQVAFKRIEKEGKVWYSHKDGDKWCNETHDKKPVDPPKDTASATEAPPVTPQQAEAQADQAFDNIPSAGKATPDQLNKLQDLKKAGINLAAKVKEYGWPIGKMADFTSDQANRLIADYAEKVV